MRSLNERKAFKFADYGNIYVPLDIPPKVQPLLGATVMRSSNYSAINEPNESNHVVDSLLVHRANKRRDLVRAGTLHTVCHRDSL
jgi:hypothetical protein